MNHHTSRRRFIKNSSTAALTLAALPAFSYDLMRVESSSMGVAAASYHIRRFPDPIEMMEHCHSLGFGGVQPGIGAWENDYIKKVRKKTEQLNMFLEGQIRLPKDESEFDIFEKVIISAKESGAVICRTNCGNRRYEDFDSLGKFKEFKSQSIRSIQLAEPILKKHKVKLAIENHKDWRTEDLLEIMKLMQSEWVGITLDTGNSISLLEDPMYVVESLAPYAFSVHLKDMAVDEYENGFLLSEVPLGEGMLDMNKMITTIKKHNPDIKFNLEMITRNPLEIPCLMPKYWATFGQISGSVLASFLMMIRNQKTKTSLPYISKKSKEEQLALEIENNSLCLQYGKQKFNFE
jgi:3-oxoisoapionate decarboxylase